MGNNQTDSPSEQYKKAKAELLAKTIPNLLGDLLIDCNYRNRESTKIMLDYRLSEMQLKILNKMNYSTNILLIFAILSFISSTIAIIITFTK